MTRIYPCARVCAGALVLMSMLVLGLTAAPTEAKGIRTYGVGNLPGATRVFDVAEASDRAMWITKYDGLRERAGIGRLDRHGKVHTHAVPWPVTGSPPMLARGANGTMWFTAGARLGRIDAQGHITSFPLPKPSAVAEDLATGSDGTVWFVEKLPGDAVVDDTRQYTNVVGRMDSSGAVTEYPVGTTSDGLPWPPSTITRGPDGAFWFTEGTAKSIGRVDAHGRVTNFPASGFCSGLCQPGSITVAGGALWFANTFAGRLGRLATSGQVRGFHVPGTSSGKPIRAIAVGSDHALWFASNGFVGRRTSGGKVTRWRLGGSQGAALATRIAAGPARTVWVATYSALYRVPVNLRKGSRSGATGGGRR